MSHHQPIQRATVQIEEALNLLKIDTSSLSVKDWIKLKTASLLLKDALPLLGQLLDEQCDDCAVATEQ